MAVAVHLFFALMFGLSLQFEPEIAQASLAEPIQAVFIDQPAITRLGLDASELTQLQSWAESLHANAGVNGVSFGPPSSGTLATIQATALVTPPTGLEAGYVPIVIRQY